NFQLTCAPFKEHRNKRLAHLDFETSMTPEAALLPGISRKMIEAAMMQIRNFMNRIEGHYEDSETGYEHFILRDDGNRLLSLLKFGMRYEELQGTNALNWNDLGQSRWAKA